MPQAVDPSDQVPKNSGFNCHICFWFWRFNEPCRPGRAEQSKHL